MNEYLLRMIFARPFVPFTLLLHGGHVIDVLSPEFIAVEHAILFVTVYDPSGHRCYVDAEKIVALRTVHAVEE